METEQNKDSLYSKPTLAQLWQDIKKHKLLYYKILSVTFVVSVIIAFSIPNYYNCTVMLAPELTTGKVNNSLANLASNFGVNLSKIGGEADALMPNLYPDLMNSVAFKTSLFPIKVKQKDSDSSVTYYSYLLNEQHLPWWSSASKYIVKSIISLFAEEEESQEVDPFKLTEEQTDIVKLMNKKVNCSVDDNTYVISISVTDQDPLIAATLADSVQVRLQDYIIEYRTRKARVDLVYYNKLYQEAKKRYETALKKYASFSDANQKLFLERLRIQRTELENDLQIQLNIYTQVSAQMQWAEAKVQEETPAFSVLQPATVPVKKKGPNRIMICFVFLFFSTVGVTLYILIIEKDISALFSRDNENEHLTLSGSCPFLLRNIADNLK